jgi:hypothetical protein
MFCYRILTLVLAPLSLSGVRTTCDTLDAESPTEPSVGEIPWVSDAIQKEMALASELGLATADRTASLETDSSEHPADAVYVPSSSPPVRIRDEAAEGDDIRHSSAQPGGIDSDHIIITVPLESGDIAASSNGVNAGSSKVTVDASEAATEDIADERTRAQSSSLVSLLLLA